MGAHEKNSNLFRKESLDRISSPDKLDEYLRVTKPSTFFLLAAVIILLAALLIWSAFGTLPTVIQTTAIAKNGELTFYCSTEKADELSVGQEVKLGSYPSASLAYISDHPLSDVEIRRGLDDYSAYMLELEKFNYELKAYSEDVPDGFIEVKIVTGTEKPISFLFN